MDILKDKQYKQFNRLSRYSDTPVYYNTVDHKYMCGITPSLSKGTACFKYTIEPLDTIDSLALKFYNNPTYYWVICDFNNINDPFVELIPGGVLYIPTLSAIDFN